MYVDETVLKIKNQVKQLKQKNIKEEVHIQGEELEFEETIIIEGELSMVLPTDFIDLPKEVIKAKYPSRYRPQIIKTDQKGNVNIGYSCFKPEPTLDLKEIQKRLQKMQPGYTFYGLDTLQGVNTKVEYFDFKGYALECGIYCVQFMCQLTSHTILGSFNCDFNEIEEWKPIVLQMMGTIKDLKKYEEECL